MTGLVNKAFRRSPVIDDADKKIVNTINNYVIPGVKSEIIEFIILSDSRISAAEKMYVYTDDEYESDLHEKLMRIWATKLKEAVKKGDFLFANDREYQSVRFNIMSKRYMREGLCRYCGGDFKGVLRKVCSECGRPKDY